MKFKFFREKNSSKYLLFVVCLFYSLSCFSQVNLTLKGTIKNSRTNEVVPFATVYCKDLKAGTVADFQGFFYIEKITTGKHHFSFSSIGYEPLDTLLTVSKKIEIEIRLKEKQLTLDEVVVTAQASKDLPTSSVIKQSALRHLQPNSFADILELIPGGLALKREMTSVNLISLREPSYSTNYSCSNNTSLGTAFVIDGVPLSNDAQLQNTTGALSNFDISRRNSTGKGIDMRMISTDDIEKVEIVRGIPSVKYGDLTSGVVRIERSYKTNPFRIRSKATPSSKLIALGKGFSIGKHTINTNFDYINYLSDPRNVKVNYNRMTASLRYANAKSISGTPVFFTTSVDYTGSFDETKRDEETDTKEENYKNNYNKVRLSSRLLWHKKESCFDELGLSLSGSYTHNEKIINRIVTGNISPILNEVEDGEYYGKFLPAEYLAHLETDGKPLYLFAKIHSQFHWDINTIRNNIYLGCEWRFSKNLGNGEVFDVNRPLFSGNGRPRRSKDIPAMQNLSFYGEDNLTIPIGKSKLNAQIGIRASSLVSMKKAYTKLHNKVYFDPRANLSFVFPEMKLWKLPVIFTLHAGMGWHTKMPTLSHLYPNKKYFDFVQLNYYSQNASLRQMQYKLKVIDPTNTNIKPNRNKKWELGISGKIGKVFFDIGYYQEVMNEGFRIMNNYDLIDYKRYESSSVDPSTLIAPPTVDMFQYKSYRSFILYSQYVNGAVEQKSGVEYSLNLGNISTIRSDVSINGAWMKMKYGQSLPRYKTSGEIINDKEYPYLGYYEWDNSKEYEQFNTNIRFDTKIDKLGLIFSSTLQTIWYTQWKYVSNNGMPTYYIDKANKRYTYTKEDIKNPILKSLYTEYTLSDSQTDRKPITIDFNLKITKRITENISFGFYVNRIMYYYPDYTENRGRYVRRQALPYFGMELNVKL